MSYRNIKLGIMSVNYVVTSDSNCTFGISKIADLEGELSRDTMLEL